jgi:hypothetical protein
MSWFSDLSREFKKRRRVRAARIELETRFAKISEPRPAHGLDKPLVVSLTSYAKRFDTLPLTLKCILSQSMRPDQVVLWLGHEDKHALTPEMIALAQQGLEIAFTDNLRSYTKIIPALAAFPDAHILTLDDDIHYGPDIVADLVGAHRLTPDNVVCHRAHRIALMADGRPDLYENWDKNTGDTTISALTFPTGVMGVLYPQGVFHEDVAKRELFQALCPTADDVWLYWMWRLTGHKGRKIGKPCRVLEWPGSQTTRLQDPNVASGGNDAAFQVMVARYGFASD